MAAGRCGGLPGYGAGSDGVLAAVSSQSHSRDDQVGFLFSPLVVAVVQ